MKLGEKLQSERRHGEMVTHIIITWLYIFPSEPPILVIITF